jgi:D-cysteine desulfhydrase
MILKGFDSDVGGKVDRIEVPSIELGRLPTPVIRLSSLCEKLGAKNIFVKNDGVSGVPFGGNKVRKLEFLLADAIGKGAKSVVTVGQAGSNHALTTIVCAKRVGLEAHSVLSPQLNATYVRRNLLLSLCFDGNVHYAKTDQERDKIAKKIDAYFIPIGGSNSLGTLGFVKAAFELKAQIEQGTLPEPDYIYVALGSAGTAAGLILGARLAGLSSKIVAVRISGTEKQKSKTLVELLNKTSSFLHKKDKKFPEIIFHNSDFEMRHEFMGDEYALVTPETADAIKILHDLEGIKLEGTYTGKTFAALLHDVKTKKDFKDKNILFWNTFCSGKFTDFVCLADYKNLPGGLHRYFEEEVQELDQGL